MIYRTFTVAEATDISPMALKALVNHSLGSDVTSGYIQITAERLRERWSAFASGSNGSATSLRRQAITCSRSGRCADSYLTASCSRLTRSVALRLRSTA
jgi:hypothetical protein